MIGIDDRWEGVHGIGRYAREVLPKLDVSWTSLMLTGNPAHPLDMLRSRIRTKNRQFSTIYSPGFNGFLSSARQIITLHDLIHLSKFTPGSQKYRVYYDGFLRPLIRRNGYVITVSETSRNAIATWLNDDTVEILDAGNGCSADFTPTGDSFRSVRPFFLYVGNHKPHKNTAMVFQAMQLLGDHDLVVVSNDREKTFQLANQYQISDRLQLFSNLKDAALAKLYRGALATFMPSLEEGFGLPALESINCGTPVVYWSDCESVKEIVGEDGIAVQTANDQFEWAEAAVRATKITVSQPLLDNTWETVAGRISELLKKFD